MYKYRLTKRGKSVISMLTLIILVAFSIASVRINASARNNAEIRVEKDTIKANTISLSPLNSQLERETDAGISDESSDERVNTEKENNILNQPDMNNNEELCINVEQAYVHDGKKIAFLTFDDGPSSNITPGVLKTLSNYNVRATFFVLGSLCIKNSGTIKKMVQAGNAVGIHTYSHRYSEIYGSTGKFLNEIKKTDTVLKQILGGRFTTRLFRFPGGSFGKDRGPFKSVLAKAGYAYVDWNAVTGDGESSDLTPKQLQDRLEATSKNRSRLVILMHDSESKSTTLQALPQIIEYLRAHGYEFATLK